MNVVGVPSLVDKSAYTTTGCTMLASLLDFKPEHFGLPAFEDQVHGTVPLEEPWRLKGEVIKGFGRGSQVRTSICAFLRSRGLPTVQEAVSDNCMPIC